MAYGLGARSPIENDPVEQPSEVRSSRPTSGSWRALSAACRIEAIEQALRAVNDQIDGFPVAL